MNEQNIDIVKLIQDEERIIREYLNSHGKKDDPVKVKHLEIIIGHLHSILIYLGPLRNVQSNAELKKASLISILDQIKELEKMSPDNAWELSNLLEIELIRLGDDTYLYMLLKAQKKADNIDLHRWEKHFPVDNLEMLLNSYICGEFREGCRRLEARCFLEYLKQAQIEEYRYDRTKIQLRGKYIAVMTAILALLLLVLAYSYYKTANPPFYLLLLVLFAGAVGSVLSHAFKLGKQPLHAENNGKTREPPLGIRALISERKVFIAQPVIGATAALILFLIFSSGTIQVANKTSEPAVYGMIAFLAGFSEVYFIGILYRVAGQTGGSMR